MNKTLQRTLIASAMLAFATTGLAQSNADLLKELQSMKARIAELEKKLAERPAAPTTNPSPALRAPSPLGGEREDSMKWSEFVAGKARFKIYGFLRGDAIYDDSRPGGNGVNSSLIPAFVLSENGLGGAANLAPGPNHENFTAHPRLSRLGVDFTGPDVDALWGAKTGGKLEIDFYNFIPGGAESREFVRMRHAYAQLKWDDAMVLAGQTADLISQHWPVVNPDFGGMWGAGNLGDRRPQFRADWTPKLWGGTAFVQGMVGLTGADDNRDLDANGIRDGEASGLPTVQARVGYRFPIWEKQSIELALWSHQAREKVDIAIGGRNNFNSEAWGFDFLTPLYKDILSLKAEGWTGKNLDDVRGGILQGVNVATGREIHATGGWGELTFKPAKWYSLHSGYMFDNPRSSDLPVSSPELNSLWYLAARLYLDPIELGLDYVNWTTYFKDATGPQGKGQDNRFQAFISYKF